MKIRLDRFTTYERKGDSRTVYAEGDSAPIIEYNAPARKVYYSNLLTKDSAKELLIEIDAFEGFAAEESEEALSKCAFIEIK